MGSFQGFHIILTLRKKQPRIPVLDTECEESSSFVNCSMELPAQLRITAKQWTGLKCLYREDSWRLCEAQHTTAVVLHLSVALLHLSFSILFLQNPVCLVLLCSYASPGGWSPWMFASVPCLNTPVSPEQVSTHRLTWQHLSKNNSALWDWAVRFC